MEGVLKKIFERLLRKHQNVPSDTNIYVQNCEKWISIHDPLEPRSEIDRILVDAKKIRPWAIRQLRDVMGGSANSKAARIFLPDWLGTIPRGSKLISRPEENLNRHIYSGLDYFNRHSWTKYWCAICGDWADGISDQTENRNFNGETSSWTSIIVCKKGHEIFRRDRSIKYLGIFD